jgi:gluconokinase
MVVLVMGVSGSGKTTVGRRLAERIGARFVDGDDHHPAANVAKMRSRASLGVDRPSIHLVFLSGSRDLIRARMSDRDHFMPATLLDSQFALLEPPHDALSLDISKPPETLVATIVSALALT